MRSGAGLKKRGVCLALTVLLCMWAGWNVQAAERTGILIGIRWVETEEPEIQAREVEVPILMYHNLTRDPEDPNLSDNTMWEGQFRRQLELLEENGFETVSFQELIDFGQRGIALPEKPVCITFDDGYLSTYEIAFPLLQEFEMKATVFPIGVSMGKNTYKETEIPIFPHFDWEQAKEMVESGFISLQSHSYDMHQWIPYESPEEDRLLRPNLLCHPEETEEAYVQAVTEDLTRSREEIQKATEQEVTVLAYPGGAHDVLSEELVQSLGFQCTVTIRPEKAVISPCVPESLYALGRFYVKTSTTEEEFLKWLS